MIPLRFHHVGVGTTAFEEALEVYESLGYARTIVVDDPGLRVRIALLDAPHGPTIEIVAPLGDDSPLRSFIQRKQLPSPYHTCYEVQDIRAARDWLVGAQGFLALGEPLPAVAFAGRRIAFQYHPAVGLIELVEAAPRAPAR
jgi:methylmalonyl-CoA/ethylmalonyl-CoA epimerase